MANRHIRVGPYCRRPPYNKNRAETEFKKTQDTYNRNHRPRGGWNKNVSKDLIDYKALKDSTLTRKENNKLIRSMFNFKNIM